MLPSKNDVFDKNMSNTSTDSTNDEFDSTESKAHGEIRPLATIEKEVIEHAIRICDGNIPKAAALLEVSPSTIYRKKQSWE